MSKSSIGSFKGNPTISLDCESKYPFSFGLVKARLILEHLEAIKRFVDSHDHPNAAARDAYRAEAAKLPSLKGYPQPDRFDMAVEDAGKERCGL